MLIRPSYTLFVEYDKYWYQGLEQPLVHWLRLQGNRDSFWLTSIPSHKGCYVTFYSSDCYKTDSSSAVLRSKVYILDNDYLGTIAGRSSKFNNCYREDFVLRNEYKWGVSKIFSLLSEQNNKLNHGATIAFKKGRATISMS